MLGRRAEGYHGRLLEAARKSAHADGTPVSIHDINAVKSAGLEELLKYDRHPRLAFVDHFFAAGTTLENLARVSYDELGDFCGTPYEVVDQSASSAGATRAPAPRRQRRRARRHRRQDAHARRRAAERGLPHQRRRHGARR